MLCESCRLTGVVNVGWLAASQAHPGQADRPDADFIEERAAPGLLKPAAGVVLGGIQLILLAQHLGQGLSLIHI